MGTGKKQLFQITEAAHTCGLSRSTLMRMEEKGLLMPAYTAPDSGRRYYDNHNVARILQIEKFKAMGLSAGDRRVFRPWRRGIGTAGGSGKASAGSAAQRRGDASAGHGAAQHLRADDDTARRHLLYAVVYRVDHR